MNPFRCNLLLATAFAMLAIGCQRTDSETSSGTQPPNLTSADLQHERARASYMVGLDVARDLDPIKREIDLDIVQRAARAALEGQKPLMGEAELARVRKDFFTRLRANRQAEARLLGENNLKAGRKFLAENADRSDVVTTGSGLQYQVLRAAGGPRPSPTDTVGVHYFGSTLDGKKFADTYSLDHSTSFSLARVMPGLAEGLALMPVGSKYRFWIPPELAHGERGRPGEIEPNATLMFEIELLEIAGTQVP